MKELREPADRLELLVDENSISPDLWGAAFSTYKLLYDKLRAK